MACTCYKLHGYECGLFMAAALAADQPCCRLRLQGEAALLCSYCCSPTCVDV
jgi:hypothetical protein